MGSDAATESTITSRWGNQLLRKRIVGIPLFILLLAGILVLGSLLRFVNLSAVGDGNLYYAAAVKSMLTSWNNFFFVAAEPGGSVTVDKPPLGLWVQVLSAAVFGVNTFGLMLPQILAGLGSVVLVFMLVRRWFGEGAGLVAALILAVTPVSVAVERNNTMDALLIFTLLLAVWMFVLAAERSPGWLLAGGLLIGLAFNIKMLQAYLPVPAMFLYYFLSGRQRWVRKVFYILLTGVVILVVSFAWVVVVDSTPEEGRPYIGSSENNTVMELIFGHNGLNRLFGRQGADSVLAGILGTNEDPSQEAGPGMMQNPERTQPPAPAGQGLSQRPPAGGRDLPLQQPPGGRPQAGGPGQSPSTGDGIFPPPEAMAARSPDGQTGNQEIGTPGLVRLFAFPLANEISWLLPFGLGMLLVLAFSSPLRFPLEQSWQAVLLWGGWLLTCVGFFSFAGFFHAYYLAMLAPPLAAIIAAGLARLWKIGLKKPWLAAGILWVLAVVTFAHQVRTAGLYASGNLWLGVAGLLLAAGVVLGLIGNLLLKRILQRSSKMAGMILVLASLVIVPLVWSIRTTLVENPHTGLPGAYSESTLDPLSPSGGPSSTLDPLSPSGGPSSTLDPLPPDGGPSSTLDPLSPDGGRGSLTGDEPRSPELIMLDFLQENTLDMEYLLAVPGSMQGAQYVLATGRPVLYLGGFNGGDPVMDLVEFRQLIADGDLRFILAAGDSGQNANTQIFRWVRQTCSRVSENDPAAGSLRDPSRAPSDGRPGAEVLFDCAAALSP